MIEHRDRDLEQLFDAARAADARRAPSLARIMAPRRDARRASKQVLVMALATVMLGAVAIWRYATPNEMKLEIAFTAGEMYVPTDYLLDIISFPRAGEVPRIGASDWYPLPLPGGDAGPETRRTP